MIRSLAEPFLDTTSDFAEIIFAIFGVAAKPERRRILERTARGRADAKANGVKFGRKPILTAHQQKEARKRLEAGETQRSVARSYNVSQSNDFTAHSMIDKSEAARKQVECAIRLIAAREDDLAVHTLAMAAFGILNDLAAARTIDYGPIFRPLFTEIGWSHLTSTANFLKHADRDPEAILALPDPRENHWRIGFCLLLYRSVQGTLTPTMAAFHNWMVIRHPDEFRLAEDDDKAFEEAYRHSIRVLKESGQDVEMFLLNALIETYQKGIISPNIGFERRPRQ